MAMTNLNIRIDEEIKNQFAEICENIGLSMSSAFNVFAKAMIRERRVPFELKDNDPFYSKENMEILHKSLEDYRNGKMTSHELVEV